MARRCELTDTGVQAGCNVSHSNRHTKRRFLPNLQNVSLKSEALRRVFSLRITSATLRSVDHNSGLDGFLLNTPANRLSELGRKLRRQIKKATPDTAIILFPFTAENYLQKDFKLDKFKKPKLHIMSKPYVTSHLYPRKAVFERDKHTDPNYEHYTHVAIIANKGYEYFPHYPKNIKKHKYAVVPRGYPRNK